MRLFWFAVIILTPSFYGPFHCLFLFCALNTMQPTAITECVQRDLGQDARVRTHHSCPFVQKSTVDPLEPFVAALMCVYSKLSNLCLQASPAPIRAFFNEVHYPSSSSKTSPFLLFPSPSFTLSPPALTCVGYRWNHPAQRHHQSLEFFIWLDRREVRQFFGWMDKGVWQW